MVIKSIEFLVLILLFNITNGKCSIKNLFVNNDTCNSKSDSTIYNLVYSDSISIGKIKLGSTIENVKKRLGTATRSIEYYGDLSESIVNELIYKNSHFYFNNNSLTKIMIADSKFILLPYNIKVGSEASLVAKVFPFSYKAASKDSSKKVSVLVAVDSIESELSLVIFIKDNIITSWELGN